MAFVEMPELLTTDVHKAAESRSARSWPWGVGAFFLALLPSLAAIWLVPGFVTQDGPAHLYNAHILVESFNPTSPFRDYYQVRWQPLPNWAGHVSTAAAFCLSPRWADQIMTSLTLVSVAACIVWLRWRVAGWQGMPLASVLAVLLSLNVAWLLGFTSFLLGACLFPITLGYWWAGREQLGARRVVTLGLLLVVGYFCHLVSLALTVFGLGILALFAPGERWRNRLLATLIALLPLVPLAVVYLGLSRQGGGMQPVWKHLSSLTSLRSWAVQLGWVDPISLASRLALPFVPATSPGYFVFCPVVWLAIGLTLAGVATYRAHWSPERRCWFILAASLLVGGLVCPDTLGANHGNYLQQRIILVGLVALVPCFAFQVQERLSLAGALALVFAFAVQSAFVWDYAFSANRTAGVFLKAVPEFGRGQRVATLLLQTRGKFRANPLWHADNLLGINTGNILWNNYETRHYYFPVQFKPGNDRPSADEMERIATLDQPQDAQKRIDAWTHLLQEHHASIDTLVVWGDAPAFDAINERWFRAEPSQGKLRIFRHR